MAFLIATSTYKVRRKNRRYALTEFISIALASIILLMAMPLWAKPLVFVPLPLQKPKEVISEIRPMLHYLEQQLGTEIQIRYLTSYEAIIDAFVSGEIDLAYLGPLPYVDLHQHKADAIPLVLFKETNGAANYTCALVANDPAVLNKQQPLNVALTQPLSTCGYLSVASLLKKRGIDLSKQNYRYLNAHDKAILSVVAGESDIAGAKTSIAKRFKHLAIKVLDETPPIPGFALVANQKTMNKAQIAQIQQALLKLDPSKDKAVLAEWGEDIQNGVVPAHDNDYAAIRTLIEHSAHIPTKGNSE